MFVLKNRDLSGVNIRNYPQTGALQDQKIHSMTPFESWLYDSLMRGGFRINDSFDGNVTIDWGMPVTIDFLQNSLSLASKQRNLKSHISATQMGQQLRKYLPKPEKSRLALPGNEEGEKVERKGHITFPSLEESRKFFDKKMGFKSSWPETK